MPRRSTPESRRQHLRWRQTAVYSLLGGALVVVMATAIGMWTGRLAPIMDEDFKHKPSETPWAELTPCPVGAGATYPAASAITLRVLNGTVKQGLAGDTATALAAQGFPAPTTGNTVPYDGVAKIVAGIAGVNHAYTVAQFFPEGVVITMDRREDTTVDAVLGNKFEGLLAAEVVDFDPAAVIEPARSCLAPESIVGHLPSLPETPQPSASDDAAVPSGDPAVTGARSARLDPKQVQVADQA
ncbi:MAG: LytR C-terminal domain-containing protein [Bifidobacteriaceae bacterium]|jgi:hypothetical protein|nr:LytR C-terminal domain-containing protein [Bifidobacteriaceae bacterium]